MEEEDSNNVISCDVEPIVNADNVEDYSEIIEPAVGMEFESDDVVKSFYKKYATKMGFDWRIRNSKKTEGGELYYIMLCCRREGKRGSKIDKTVKTLPTIVGGCEAKITAKKMFNGIWRIMYVVLEHRHDVSPSKTRLFQNNKTISFHVKRVIELNDEAGVRTNKTFQAFVHEMGGHDNLSFVEKDVRNYIQKERRSIGKQGDAKALVDYFRRMKEQNCNFWYDIDVDEEFHIRNIFWADARSRACYEAFGDIVSFDTTYLTNKYEMPFAAFVGVNHHGQSILLGCGLVSSEDTPTFVWLFDAWVKSMNGKAPTGIVTDQCKAMQNAIAISFPNTRHRWCLWHIMKKIPEKLKGYGAYKQIKKRMKEAVYDTHSKEEYEEKWNSFLKEYNLESNEWLRGLFNERHRWVPIFLKNGFWAGLSTTQRSESIHAFFDGYLNPKTSLQQFVKQYDNALRSKVEKEVQSDFQSMNTTIPCTSNSSIEKQFQSEYTHAKFGEVQAEFRGKMNCNSSLMCCDNGCATYIVVEDIQLFDQTREVKYEVMFNRDTFEVTCQCLLFEFRGIICRHVLSVLGIERIPHVPSKYVLNRWSKKIKRRHSYIKLGYDANELSSTKERYDKLCKHFYEVAELVVDSDNATKELHDLLENFGKNLSLKPTSYHDITTSSKGKENCKSSVEIHSPKCLKRKGRPRVNRYMTECEKAIKKKEKRDNKCSDKMVIEHMTFTSGDNVEFQSSEANILSSQPSINQQGGFMSLLESFSQTNHFNN